MKHRREHRDLEDFIGDLRYKQQNTSWPGAWVNANRIDRFLWNGSPNPTAVQRIAAWLFGLVFLGFSLEFFAFAVRFRYSFGSVLFFVTLACGFTLAGIKIFRNGFPNREDSDPPIS